MRNKVHKALYQKSRRVAVCVMAIVWSNGVPAAEIGPGDDIRVAIAALQPGDELVLHGGTYALDGQFRITVNGTANAPVVIRAADGEVPLITQATANHNILEVLESSYLVLRGIEFTGGSHGIRLMDSDYVTIDGCHVHDTGDVAISANSGGTYTGLKIINNHIHDTNFTGEGMYLGCNNDGCRVEDSLIEGNYIHHTNGPTIEQGDGIEIKEGSSGNIVRHNVIHDTNYPGILVYSTRGNGPANLIDGNIIWNTNDYAIQAAADVVIRNNIILSSSVGFQQHQSGSPSNIEFVHNTLVVQGSAVNVRNVSGPVTIANNAIYSESGNAIRLISGDTSQVVLSGNVGVGGLSGGSGGYVDGSGIAADFVNANYDAVLPMDLFPAVRSSLIGAADPAYSGSLDFNGTRRSLLPTAGAYAFLPNGNRGWQINTAFKVLFSRVAKCQGRQRTLSLSRFGHQLDCKSSRGPGGLW